MELRIEGLDKRYGRQAVLSGVALSLAPGEVVGLVGPNGAGKSTTMKIMLGLVNADAGSVHIGAISVSANRAAYLQQVAGFVDGPPQYPMLSAREHLKYVALLRGVSCSAIDDVLRTVGLAADSRKRVSRFSMGMKQRLAIAMALVQSPKFLVLDEPANGLDPAAMIELRQLIRTLAGGMGMGILISSHILSEIERVCDRVVFIRAGQVVRDVEVRLNTSGMLLSLRTTDDRSAAAILSGLAAVEQVDFRDGRLLVSIARESVPEIARLLVGRGIGLLELSPARDLLEADYLSEFNQKEMLS